MKIHTVLTHQRPHFDECVGFVLFRREGGRRYTVLPTLKLETVPDGKIPNGWTEDQAIEHGFLPLGIGRGKLDEHRTGNVERLREECAATRLASHLGIESSIEYRALLEFALRTDQRSAFSMLDAKAVVDMLGEQFPDDPMVAVEWVSLLVDAKAAVDALEAHKRMPWQEAKEELLDEIGARNDRRMGKFLRMLGDHTPRHHTDSFHIADLAPMMLCFYKKTPQARAWLATAFQAIAERERRFWGAVEEFQRNAQIVRVRAGDGTMAKIACITSDTELLGRVFRDDSCGPCDMLVKKDSRGHVVVLVDRSRVPQFTTRILAAFLREGEYEAAGESVKFKDIMELSFPGDGPDGRWYHQADAQVIMNGGPKFPGKPVTRLSLEDICARAAVAFERTLTMSRERRDVRSRQ